nr:hypothetical protein [Tanacetum cinerariifolium]
NKETTPPNIHIIQESDATVTTPADTICLSQHAIYNNTTTVYNKNTYNYNKKQQLGGHAKNMNRCRVTQPQPNSQLQPAQLAIASKRNKSTYVHRL